MALQINQEIETTNKGIVTNPYLRIETYRIDKMTGFFVATVAMYIDSNDALNNSFVYQEEFVDPLYRKPQTGPISPSLIFNGQNVNYPVVNEFPLTVDESVTEDVYTDETKTRTITYNDFDENGDIIEKTREETYTEKVKTGTRTVNKSRIDITVIGNDPFAWAYGKLKTVYEDIFGQGNVIDC
jgi:hypothetical protein